MFKQSADQSTLQLHGCMLMPSLPATVLFQPAVQSTVAFTVAIAAVPRWNQGVDATPTAAAQRLLQR